MSTLLAEKGAVVIDADRIVHEVQAPGGAAFQPIVDRFGADVVTADGTLDRPQLAAVVFNDPEALADLNKIVHPLVGAEIADRLQAQAATDNIVILDVPLLVESGRSDLAGMIVVDCPVDDRGGPRCGPRDGRGRRAGPHRPAGRREERLAAPTVSSTTQGRSTPSVPRSTPSGPGCRSWRRPATASPTRARLRTRLTPSRADGPVPAA